MNILVLNGSPKGQKSNTLKLTQSFLEGMSANFKHNIKTVDIVSKTINHCLGCYVCWTKTPGICVIKDDMQNLMEEYINADLIIWSFPLYYFGMPSKIKAFLDRLLPINLPFIETNENETSIHLPRYDLSKQKYVLISTCGFYSTKNNYDALFKQFEILYGNKLTKIICAEGELFRVPQLLARTEKYLGHVKMSGEEYANSGIVSGDTYKNLNKLLYKPDIFIEMANASWEISNDENKPNKSDFSHNYMRQMVATYNPSKYKKDIVLEMNFTDINKSYQLLIQEKKCVLITDNFKTYTTKIHTPFSVWKDISEGKLSGTKAMMDKLYTISGDFDTMLAMNELFGENKAKVETVNVNKKSNMILMLLPFLALWIFIPISAKNAGIMGILASGLVGLLHFKWKKTPYEPIGVFLVLCISILALNYGSSEILSASPYFAFGLLWFISIFMKAPLTAYYSSNDYGEEKAFENPLFIRTNRILTCMWGITNILLGFITLYVYNSPFANYWGIIGNLPTILLGFFTVWFSKWYPAYYAKSK